MRRTLPSLSRAMRLVFPLALLFLCGCSGPVLDPAGDVAREQRDIILFSTALMLLIIVPVMILIVVFAWRYRKGRGGTYDPTFDHSTPLELAIWSAPLFIIIALGALTWSSTHLLDPFRPLGSRAAAAKQSPLVVQVVSLDWKWLFIYPEQGIATVNELVLPINRPVRFDITSSNMMNTFYSPTLAGMIYAMPGMQSQMNAILRRTGDFDGYSANYSGAGFSDMHFRLRGMDGLAFERWVSDVRGADRSLALTQYRALLKPSEHVPAIHYRAVDHDLYRRILERCVDPGAVCASNMMEHDQMAGQMMMPVHDSEAAQKATGAVFKSGDVKNTGLNVTTPHTTRDTPSSGQASPPTGH